MLIFDLHHLAWRAFHTTGALKHGVDPTGVIFGVLREIQGTVALFKDPMVVIAADSPMSLRKDLFPGYKKRDTSKETEKEKAAKADCILQINLLKSEIFPCIGFTNVFEYGGYEADDIMAEIVYRKSNWEKPTIITGDEDIYQLLDFCNIWLSTKRKRMSSFKFKEEYGISPRQWPEVKAIGGCSSDTVPGVPGVGPKTAIEYLQGKLKPTSKKHQAIVEAQFTGVLGLMRKLVTLPYPGTPVSKLKPIVYNEDGLVYICEKYGLQTLLQDVPIWTELFQKRRI